MCDPIAVWKDCEIIEGHGRLIALQELGYDKVPIIRLDHLTDEQRKAYGLIHNKLTMNTGFDLELLQMELENLPMDMVQFGFDIEIDDDFTIEDEDDTYTHEINIPQYEPNGDVTFIEELCDRSKADELIKNITEADIPESEKVFLTMAAARHFKFNYKKIAEYYASATPEMQELMEQSALVIIDYEDAIKYGYAKLSQHLDKIQKRAEEAKK